jgi:hypothetical protein
MEFDLKGALKKYNRMRSRRQVVSLSIIPMCFAISWFFNFDRTDTMICLAIGMVMVVTGQIEMRLKTMQVRLAGMNDQLNQLTGDHDTASDLILELNDW